MVPEKILRGVQVDYHGGYGAKIRDIETGEVPEDSSVRQLVSNSIVRGSLSFRRALQHLERRLLEL